MTATATQANTDRMGTGPMPEFVEWPMAATAVVFAGAMGATDTSGNVVDVTNTTGLKVWGRIKAGVDNSAGAAGDKRAVIQMGVFKWKNQSDDKVVLGDRGKLCYAHDNQTVAHTSTGLSAAGWVVDIADDGDVFVL